MRARMPTLLLIAALGASAAVLVSFISQLTFIGDDWELLVGRQAWDVGSFLEPFNENLIVGPTRPY